MKKILVKSGDEIFRFEADHAETFDENVLGIVLDHELFAEFKEWDYWIEIENDEE